MFSNSYLPSIRKHYTETKHMLNSSTRSCVSMLCLSIIIIFHIMNGNYSQDDKSYSFTSSAQQWCESKRFSHTNHCTRFRNCQHQKTTIFYQVTKCWTNVPYSLPHVLFPITVACFDKFPSLLVTCHVTNVHVMKL